MGELEEARARAIALQRQAAARAAQTQTGVDLRPQPGESRDAYRARLEASRGAVTLSPGSQQMTDQAQTAMQPAPPSVMLDMANSFTAGLGRGAVQLVGLPGTVDNLITSGLEYSGIMPPLPDGMDNGNPLSGNALQGYMSTATGGATDYRGQTTAGEYAGTVGEFLPAALMPGATVKNAVQFGIVPGLASEAAGQATEGTAYEPYARAAAAILAPLAGPVGARLISPNGGADPARLAFAQTLDDAGIPVSAGQRVGNQALQRRELLTRTGQALRETQTDAFTSAALSTIGENATRATPEVMSAALARIGGEFDDVARGVDITPDAALVTSMREAVETFRELTPTAAQAPAVGNMFRELTKFFRTGQTIPADTMLTWRSRLSALRTSSDAATRQAAQQGMEALDDAMAGALTALGRTDDVARLATARGQYRNYLAIEQAANSAGEAAAYGTISPAALRAAVKAQGLRGYATGTRGDIADLARAAQGILQRPNTSGTAENLSAMGVPISTGATLGAVVGSALGGVPGAAVGTLAGSAAPYFVRGLQASRPGQAYLANQMMTPNALMIQRSGIPLLPLSTSNNALAYQ
jgi:hypothetical protein